MCFLYIVMPLDKVAALVSPLRKEMGADTRVYFMYPELERIEDISHSLPAFS